MMSAVLVRLRAEIRARWAAWLLLGLTLGIAAGAAIAAAAGARRTSSSYPRFVRAYKGYDVVLGGIGTDDPATPTKIQQEIASFPEVLDYTLSTFVSDTVRFPGTNRTIGAPEFLAGGDPRGREGFDINKARILEGRAPDPARADAAFLDWAAADRFGIKVGQRLEVRLLDFSSDSPKPLWAPVEVVGIGITPGSLPAVGQASVAGLGVTPAFFHKYANLIGPSTDAPSVRLRRGSADIASFVDRVRKLPVSVDVPITGPRHVAGVQKTLRFEVVALWALAALVGLAAAAIFGQALARQALREAEDYPVLRALGMTRRELTTMGIVRAALIAVVAVAAATVVAIVASPLTPIGLARLVEPSPGVRIDPIVIGVGIAALLIAIPIISIWPAWRASGWDPAAVALQRPSKIVSGLARASAPPALVTGAGMALNAGRGRSSVPLRSAVTGMLVGTAALAAAAIFAASLAHLVDTPELYGFGWDLIVANQGPGLDQALAKDPDVEAKVYGGAINVQIGGKDLIPFVYGRGGIRPTMLSGRAPQAADEIALGPALIRLLHARVGSDVTVRFPQGSGQPTVTGRFRLIGETVVPPFFFQVVGPGESAALTMDGVRRVAPAEVRDASELPLIVRYRPGTDVRAKVSDLRDNFPFLFPIQVRERGADLVSLTHVESAPIALAGLLGFMAAATLIHTLVSAVSRRRSDIAILMTLGFVRRQVRGAVSAQASILATIALALGLPIGIAAGRWAWNAFARNLGVVPAARTPWLVILIVPATLVLANVAAGLPARAAARTKPALVLRAE